MILLNISLVCDGCRNVGMTQASHRWLPGENIPKPDILKGWSLHFSNESGWSMYCDKCHEVK